ncbi:dTDP-4-amino-4,6-dideoxygalactose transaminase [Sphingobacteriaceae bacterium AH-315-L07]|nr:dTDP-4-amino-4,6-dideoxygalactose transaminase [Sphingobacteriaceae bacterium AH-315-L07]
MHIPFNKPYLSGREIEYIKQAIESNKTSGNGFYTQRCHEFFEDKYSFGKTFLTTSCTDALEMSAILMDIKPGDQIILPAYTFVSTANAFVLRDADLVFADSEQNTPNLDVNSIESLINPKTKAIVVVHYGGVACDMDKVLNIAKQHDLYVVEDAAQGIDSYYNGQPLGSLGDFAAFSFHETKNIISGEGGMLVVNNEKYIDRAEIIWEKGTNRAAFFRGEVSKYNWIDIGSSFLPSEITAAFLWGQLENLDAIQLKRKELWERYYSLLVGLQDKEQLILPVIPDYATKNGHLFYIVCKDKSERDSLIAHLKSNDVHALFHYLSLEQSPFYKDKHDGRKLPNAERYTDCLVRLPMYYDLSDSEVIRVVEFIMDFYNK